MCTYMTPLLVRVGQPPAELLVGSSSASGLLLSRWDLRSNASSAFGAALTGLIPPPYNAATSVGAEDGGASWSIAALTADDLSAVLVSLSGAAISSHAVTGGEDARCFAMYATPSDESSTFHCLSEVDRGTLTTTELRVIARSSGKSTIAASGLMPCFSPMGPTVYDNDRGVVVSAYVYSPCAREVGVAQGATSWCSTTPLPQRCLASSFLTIPD